MQIPVGKIWPHPNNPRKNLGELEELAESIRTRGIMQNLTVIPHPGAQMNEELADCYMAVIGHRRLAAAKLAGLETVPCVVAEMTEQEQVATMLLENIQRNDLTKLEEAEGFQMMMDFGETVESIAEKGLERGATLEDFGRLDKVKDEQLRAKVLAEIGTHNFEHALKNAIETEKRDEIRAGIVQQLEAFAQETDPSGGMQWVDNWYLQTLEEAPQLEAPEDAGETAYFYTAGNYTITLYRQWENGEPNAPEETEEARAAREAELERRSQLEAAAKMASELREAFIKNYSGSKKHLPVIYEMLVWALLCEGYHDSDTYFELMGIDLDEDTENEDENWAALALEAHDKAPEKSLLALAMAGGLDGTGERYSDWQGNHTENESLTRLYSWLEQLGYQMSDEEKALQDGTHALFNKAEGEEG